MQTKTIARCIQAKLNDWLDSISDESLRKDVKANVLVSGGSITSLFLREDVNDYDVYIMNRDVLMRLVRYYVHNNSSITILDGKNKSKLTEELGFIAETNSAYAVALRNLKDDQIKLFFDSKNGGLKVNDDFKKDDANRKKYIPLFFSPNAISLSDDIQIVIRFFGNPVEIHKTFDFIHATNYFTFTDGLVTNTRALESVLTKQLYYQGSQYPVTSIIRAKKFIKRNWNITAGELLKIMFQISQLDLSNPDVLDEQLVGVDVAYFELLITALRNKYSSDKEFKVSVEYFNTLVDKIFNDSDSEL